MLFAGAAVFAGDDPKKDFDEIPVNPGFAFARDLQSRGPRGDAGEKSPITKPYRMAKYPVTNAEYADFCKATRHRTPRYWRDGKFPKGKDRHPVLEVSVDDVEAYCRYLEKKHPGWRFRLPTEAEWENAAAGPKHFAFPWGNSDQVRMKNGLIVAPFNFNAVVASYYLAKSPELKVTFFHRNSSRRGDSVTLRELISVNERGQVRGWIDHADHTGFVYTDLFRKLADEGGFTTAVDRYPEGKSHYGCFDMVGLDELRDHCRERSGTRQDRQRHSRRFVVCQQKFLPDRLSRRRPSTAGVLQYGRIPAGRRTKMTDGNGDRAIKPFARSL